MKIVKTIVRAKSRNLNAEWSIEQSQDLEHIFDNNLQKEIDKEIMSQIQRQSLIDKGWHKVAVSRHTLSNKIPSYWVPQNIVHDFQIFSDCWMFEAQEDAVRFALEWV